MPQYPDHPTLVELLRWRAEHQSDRTAYTFLTGGQETTWTYAELDRQARGVAALLQTAASPGDRALLLFPPGLEFIAAFLGCLYAGVVAVPAYPPRNQRGMPRLQAIAADAQAVLGLTTGSLREGMTIPPEFGAFRLLTTDPQAPDADRWTMPAIGPDTLAFLQYTSGSTSTPKGVMVSQGNILANERAVQEAYQYGEDSLMVSWLPVYHDMGLIGGVLQPLHTGFPCVLMSPLEFLQRPYRWLEAISRFKATTSGGPNFAYDLCVRKITPEQRATLDLSSLRLLYNGAEPIRPETLDRFTEAFAPQGFRKEAFYPCYGLAEATLFVTGGIVQEAPVVREVDAEELGRDRAVAPRGKAFELVGCGRTWQEHRVAIADPETGSERPEGEVGEIWIKGPSVAQGYWNRPDVTQETFHARLDTGEGPFLRTGDLGFVQGSELFVTGRIKDLIIIRGRNYYPQDIERSVELCHPAVRPGCTAAFTIEVEGEERLVVTAEVERRIRADRMESEGNRAAMEERMDTFEPAPSLLEAKDVVALIRQAVSEQHELQVHEVVLLKATSIPKTSSGKIQRHACRKGFLAGTLNTVGAP